MPNLSYEIMHGLNDGKVICGVDEVGRGPLAGPVTACAVILVPKIPRSITKHIRDSKQMSAKQREELYPDLIGHCRHSNHVFSRQAKNPSCGKNRQPGSEGRRR